MSLDNFDPIEIAKFERMALHWWDPQGPCKPLHTLNPTRLEFIEQQVLLQGKTVLDIGCGGGILAESLATKGADVIGIDMSQEAIRVAQSHAAQTSPGTLRYEINTAENVAATHPGYFDIVTCMELIEHVPNPFSLVEACAKLVKPNGYVFFSTINRNFKAYAFTILGAEYLLKLLPRGTHDYASFVQPAELASWARKAGLAVQQFKGMSYNFLTQNFNLSDDLSVNYLTSCQAIS